MGGRSVRAAADARGSSPARRRTAVRGRRRPGRRRFRHFDPATPQALHPRDDGQRRRLDRLRQRRLARPVLRAGRPAAAGRRPTRLAHAQALPQQRRRHVHRRDRRGRPDPAAATAWASPSATTTTTASTTCSSPTSAASSSTTTSPTAQGGRRFVDVTAKAGLAQPALGTELRLGRPRRRRPPRPVRLQLRRDRPGHTRSRAATNESGLRSSARPTAFPPIAAPAVPQQRRRHVHRRHDVVRDRRRAAARRAWRW